MGESTTGTGRVILKHQCRKVAEVLEGSYNVDFPLYETMADAAEAGYSEEEAKQIVLYGPVFNGTFQSDAVIYGDTDSTYFKTYASNSEEAIKVADAVAAEVNASYQRFMRDTFLCNEGYDNIIKCGRELVSDRGIFVEKKRYILHIINLNGKMVDKLKVMGLDTKKTTLPADVAKELNAFIERLLKGETWESISQSIVDYKTTLKNSPNIMTIGLPKGVNGIEQYTKAYAIGGMDTRLPGHVAAAIHYNECLDRFEDRTSMRIMSGMKIKVFYLIGKHGKFKSIALPTDIEVVPQWFLDNFTINKDAHIQRLVDNPLENILKAIGKKSPTKQSMTFDSIFEF
jgi:DNA polymerase elongation subunit (family B)